MASPEQQLASDIISAKQSDNPNKLQYEANLIRSLGSGQSIQQINQELQTQIKSNNDLASLLGGKALPNMSVAADGSIKIDGQDGQYGRTVQSQVATANESGGKTTTVKDGDTTIVLNDKGEAVGYNGNAPDGKKQAVYLDRDGHWKEAQIVNGMSDPTQAKDLGTVAPVLDKTTGELKSGDACKSDGKDTLLSPAKNQPGWAVWAQDFLLIQDAINNFDTGKY